MLSNFMAAMQYLCHLQPLLFTPNCITATDCTMFHQIITLTDCNHVHYSFAVCPHSNEQHLYCDDWLEDKIGKIIVLRCIVYDCAQ